jgi:hypothetical protein
MHDHDVHLLRRMVGCIVTIHVFDLLLIGGVDAR